MSQADGKWQSEVEEKKRQLEDDRRALHHVKSKALRERWLLDGAPPVGDEQKQQHEEHAKNLEDTVSRLEKELMNLESTGACTSSVRSGTNQEVRVHQAGGDDMMKRAMYSVEIKVERDKATGETRVLSSHTKLPVDCSHGGVKVYEDDQKVVHEVNGEDGVHLLSAAEVDELILKADEALTTSCVAVREKEEEEVKVKEEGAAAVAEITGLEATPQEQGGTEEPVTMVFMGYQDVEDQDHTKEVLGLQGTVKAELVLIEDRKTPPSGGPMDAPPMSTTIPEIVDKCELAGVPARGTVKTKKEKEARKCCIIM
ncbi:paralemmin 1a [Dunckerocampus dactyliophorus]|uniref:paralemmin 1a n=1 Tax=Dunckerocampus dactyliophorus TaxID=161453 RepID=UPI002406BC69|nr:paralemmin 1a [Dunckerocampus dactyliophorus]